MSKMRKSLAVLSSAIAPILLVNSSASAGVNLNLYDGGALPANWPTSTIGATAVIDSGTSTGTPVPGGPTNYTANESQTLSAGTVLGQTFTTPAGTGFNLGAISFVVGGGGTDTTNDSSIHLFQLSSVYTPTAGFYTLGNGGQEVGNDLLGGGNGLTFNTQSNANAIYEFDFTGADQVNLLPNTQYAVELWSGPNGIAPTAYYEQANAESYTGGSAYITNPNNFTPADQEDHSPTSRLSIDASPGNLLFAVYSNSLAIAGPSFWNVTTSGNWDTASNWSSITVPNGIGVEADFLSTTSLVGAPITKNGLTSAGNVYTDTAKTVGIMNFDNTNGYVLDGAGSLTLQVASGSAAVNVLSGIQEINIPLTVASNTTFTVSSGATLKISDPMTINTGVSLTNNGGTGTVTYQSSVTVLGSGNITLAAPTVIHALILSGSSATAVVSPKGASVNLLQLDSLSTVSGSSLNLNNNALILHGGPVLSVASQLGTAFTELKNGFNAGSGYWNGTNGIVSATAAADTRHLTALGFMQSQGGTFDGVSTTTNDVLVKYTYYGDADLNGTVNGADYQQIDAGFGAHGTNNMTGWAYGDFNYDGVVDGSDYSLIDNTFNQITANSLSPLALIASQSAVLDSTSVSPANVPEPATLSLLGIGALSLLGRRRRNV